MCVLGIMCVKFLAIFVKFVWWFLGCYCDNLSMFGLFIGWTFVNHLFPWSYMVSLWSFNGDFVNVDADILPQFLGTFGLVWACSCLSCGYILWDLLNLNCQGAWYYFYYYGNLVEVFERLFIFGIILLWLYCSDCIAQLARSIEFVCTWFLLKCLLNLNKLVRLPPLAKGSRYNWGC